MKIKLKRVNPTKAYPFIKELHEKLIPLQGRVAHEGVTSIIDDEVQKFKDQIINLEDQGFINPPDVEIIPDGYSNIEISFEELYPEEEVRMMEQMFNCPCRWD